MKELRGRTAIVTGASRGIGVHIARELAQAGVNLALVARTGEAIERLANEFRGTGVRAVALVADLAVLEQLDSLVLRAKEQLGEIDVLVNNAGMDGIRFFLGESDAQTEQMVRLDLLSPMLLTRKVLPEMISRKSGHIVNVSSLAGKTAAPFNVAYSSAKGGLVAFTHALRGELRGSGVSASVVCPGFVSGEGMFAKQEQAHGVRVSRFLGTSTPQDVAHAVLRVLREDRVEIVVNPGPARLIQAINQLAPEAVAWMQERMGVNGMLRTLALAERNEG